MMLAPSGKWASWPLRWHSGGLEYFQDPISLETDREGKNRLDSPTGKSNFSLKCCHQRWRLSRAWITLVIITKTWLKVGTENLSWSQIPPPEPCQGTGTSHKWTVDHWGKSARKDDCVLSNILALLEHLHHCFVRLVSPVNCKGWGVYIAHEDHSFGDKAIDIMKIDSYFFSSLPFPFLSSASLIEHRIYHNPLFNTLISLVNGWPDLLLNYLK